MIVIEEEFQSEIGEIQFIQDVTGKVAGLDPPFVS